MLHSSRIHVPSRARQRFAVRTIFPTTSFSPPDSKEPLRRGILFSTVALILLLLGTILTWLGFNDVFGGKISMTGPLLITIAALMMLLSCRQFMLFRKRNRPSSTSTSEHNLSGLTAVVVDHDDFNGAATATIVLDTYGGIPVHNGIGFQRVSDDLAPPAYTDVAQLSCSSNCPSFISYDDRNEAPPTYEETCPGVVTFGSESSLSTSYCRRSSSDSPRLSQSGRVHIENDKTFLQKCPLPRIPTNSDTTGPVPPMNPTGPNKNSAMIVPAAESTFSPFQSNLDSSIPRLVPVSSNTANVSLTSHVQMAPWSRRSFSSIPSYTCLLSESGEVSAQVFNTSSIIQEMMPSSSSKASDTAATYKAADTAATYKASDTAATGSPSVLGGAAPTRSHSMSSVHALPQGVPYDLLQQHQHPSARPTHPGNNALLQEQRLDTTYLQEVSKCPSKGSQSSDPGVDPSLPRQRMTALPSGDLPSEASGPHTHCAPAHSSSTRPNASPVLSCSTDQARPNVLFLPERRISYQNRKHQDIQETI